MRSRKALVNIFASLVAEIVSVICGFILPRLILSSFGSSYNGITSSITQFLGYVSLMRAGIGGVTKAALYKSLADKNNEEISAIINATDRFLKKVALIFGGSMIVIAAVYPLFVQEDFDWFFSFSLVLIIGFSTFVQYFFALTYQFLLQADQRQSVISYVQIASTILNTLLAALLIKLGAGIHVVKLGSALVFTANRLFLNAYVKRYYKIDKTVPPNNEAIKDRWDCFGLQVANFVNMNTDLVILTMFTNLLEVSVYSVYNMVVHGLRSALMMLGKNVGTAFGSMFAKNEIDLVRRNLLLYEQIIFFGANLVFSTTFVLLPDFVAVYTNGVTDVDYVRPLFSAILVLATLFNIYRIPYQTMAEVVGHFKQTRNGAFFEAFLNIAVSVLMVKSFGLVGVAIGTLCAAVFRTFQYEIYMATKLIQRSHWPMIKRMILSAATFAVVVFLSGFLPFDQPENYVQLLLKAIPVGLTAGITCLLVEVLFYLSDLKLSAKKVKNALKRKGKKSPKGA